MSRKERPLVVLNLMAHRHPESRLIVDAHHRFTDPERTLIELNKDSDASALVMAGGIQVTGSLDMVNDIDYAARWSKAIESAAEQGIPVLAVCFGHQMLGTHFGSTLESWETPRVGISQVTFEPTGPFAAETIPIVLTHRDYLSKLGPDLEACATGGLGGIQAWRHKELPIWGIQAHPEGTAQIGRAMEPKEVEGIPDEVLDTPEAKLILARFGKMML